MTNLAALIAEVRAAGVRLSFDGERLCAYAPSKPDPELIDRLRAARPQLEQLLRAEQDLLDTARMLDLFARCSPDPTTASAFRGTCKELREASLEGDVPRIWVATGNLEASLPKRREPPLLGPQTPPEVLEALARARARLGPLAADLPANRRPGWDELDPLERTRQTESESHDVERGLAAVAAWERAVRALLLVPRAATDIAGAQPS